MDLKTLKYFVTIAEEGNISRAAKKLFMSQPPLSNQMKNLEKELGVTLFERGSQTIVLTDEGKFLYDKAVNLLEYVDDIKEEIIDKNNYSQGTIRIGVVSSVGMLVVNDYIHDFIVNKKNRSDFEMFEGNTYSLIEKLNSGLIDIAIVRTPFNANNFGVINLKNERVVVVGKEKFSLEDLYTKGIIAYRRWQNIIKAELEKKNIKYRMTFSNDDARTTMDLVKSGLGIGVVPESILDEDDNLYVDTSIIDINSDICAIYSLDRYKNHTLTKFIEHLNNQNEENKQ